MRTLSVDLPGREYKIYIDSGLLGCCADILAAHVSGKKAAVISDSNVAPLYAERLEKQLAEAGAKPFRIVVEAGENSKSLGVFEQVLSEIMEHDFSRSDCVVALGGGVVGDLAGFVASTLLRGVKLIQVPTTLLSQVDSSVGGKTAVNLAVGKNLVGTFYQPSAVLIDMDTLSTLPEREVACGMAEIIKYAAIRDAKMADELLSGNFDLADIIARCCAIKAAVVLNDERDTGERMLLNFGHTIGHAIENFYGYGTYSHGAAVAMGMCIMTEYAEKNGLTEPGTLDIIRRLNEKFGLPTVCEHRDQLITAASHDKKRTGDYISIVLVRRMGEGYYKKVHKSELEIIAKGE
ncbi:MAG: 3-dehydroquinate synthase [Oscillospiraceae bacterium]|nr:3-dehydroquinate synthase [Oscillospiraceae bacterium]